MPDWIETEIKLLLSDEAAYRRVAKALGSPTGVLQRNCFFEDEAGSLRAARIGVRLRAEGDARLLTLKGDAAGARSPEDDPDIAPASASEATLAHRIELETPIPDATYEAALRDGLELGPWLEHFERAAGPAPLPPPLARFLATLRAASRDRRLACRARFDNLRALARIELADAVGPLPVELALDCSRFPGDRIDYEIEVELDPESARDPAWAARIERALRDWLDRLGAGEVRPAASKLARLQRALADLGTEARRAGPSTGRTAGPARD